MNNWDRRKFSDIKSGPYVKRESRMKTVIKKVQLEYFWKKFWEFSRRMGYCYYCTGCCRLLFTVKIFKYIGNFFHIGVNYFFHCIKNRLFSIVIFFNRDSRSYSCFFKGARYRFSHTAGISFKRFLLKLSYPEPCQEDSEVKGFGVWVHL